MNIIINGNSTGVPDGSSVRDVLELKQLPDALVIVTLNDEMLPRESWDGTILNAGDNLEVIRIIGGG